MRETVIENYLAEQVGEHGGVAVKLGIGGGWPDRLVILPESRVGFCELKRPGSAGPTVRQPTLKPLGSSTRLTTTKRAATTATDPTVSNTPPWLRGAVADAGK